MLEKKTRNSYDLVFFADPSIDRIRFYIQKTLYLFARRTIRTKIVGIIVLFSEKDAATVEIMNIAVIQDYQNKGIGTKLLRYATNYTSKQGYKEIEIDTANSSIGQLYFYQKYGFRFKKILKNCLLTFIWNPSLKTIFNVLIY
ncbi:MAG: GNAT family N-acetyltransferase [Candidatus Lokiarchaeota archaeon]|nr:GNAT family N-acetyltransferase [Candidatus Lokiarchaeota archaeon]MBD3340944.1 GNAT family N-acetyltransferase [Candidatus Lokiarchaeota archaeon]